MTTLCHHNISNAQTSNKTTTTTTTKIKFNINENYISFFFSYVLPKSIFLTNFFSMHEFSFPLYPLYNE